MQHSASLSTVVTPLHLPNPVTRIQKHGHTHRGSRSHVSRSTVTLTEDHGHTYRGPQSHSLRITVTLTEDHSHTHQGSRSHLPRATCAANCRKSGSRKLRRLKKLKAFSSIQHSACASGRRAASKAAGTDATSPLASVKTCRV